VHTEVVDAMREVGIHLSEPPQLLTRKLSSTADIVVNMGCGGSVPVAQGAQRIDWPLDDPNGRSMAVVRAIRAQVRARVLEMIAEQGWSKRVVAIQSGSAFGN
jgi:arsenate reductase